MTKTKLTMKLPKVGDKLKRMNRGSISGQIRCEHDRHSVGGYHFETIF